MRCSDLMQQAAAVRTRARKVAMTEWAVSHRRNIVLFFGITRRQNQQAMLTAKKS
jgi:hypothetical protein